MVVSVADMARKKTPEDETWAWEQRIDQEIGTQFAASSKVVIKTEQRIAGQVAERLKDLYRRAGWDVEIVNPSEGRMVNQEGRITLTPGTVWAPARPSRN
jgi:hypothetical protein